MRNLIYTMNLTLDGCFDHTYMLPVEELFEYYTRLIRDADLLIYGRKTYEIMAPYWPDIANNPAGETKEDVEFAEAFDSASKIVFSQTLEKIEGKNTRLVRTGLVDEIIKLKQEQGKDMLVGGVALPSQLIAQGLVDEYLFVVHPTIAGKGKRLMEEIDLVEKIQLKLIDSKPYASGAVALHYLKQ